MTGRIRQSELVRYPSDFDEARRKAELRQFFLAVHPEWRGLIRIGRYSITVRHLGTVYWREPQLSAEQEAEHFLEQFEWMIRDRSDVAMDVATGPAPKTET